MNITNSIATMHLACCFYQVALRIRLLSDRLSNCKHFAILEKVPFLSVLPDHLLQSAAVQGWDA